MFNLTVLYFYKHNEQIKNILMIIKRLPYYLVYTPPYAELHIIIIHLRD